MSVSAGCDPLESYGVNGICGNTKTRVLPSNKIGLKDYR